MVEDIPMHLVIVGNRGGSNIAESLFRGAERLGWPADIYGVEAAASSIRMINALSWRLRDKRPPFSWRISRDLEQILDDKKPSVLITTGLSAVSAKTISAYKERGVVCMHFSSDDPWNAGQRAEWHHRALTSYDIVFTPRRSNLLDLERLPCRRVCYLPFAFDEDLVSAALSTAHPQTSPDALFVGGADTERADFFKRYLAAAAPVTLVGAYWDRFRGLTPHSIGHMKPEDVGALTQAAAVNLCLTRRANRDGHVMRSFEIAALGGCMVVEDTEEHREIFGADGHCVVYFRTPEEAADCVRKLLANTPERKRLADAVRQHINSHAHTYTDRLKTMMEEANKLHAMVVSKNSLQKPKTTSKNCPC
jgi:spore maturation protein CgeB